MTKPEIKKPKNLPKSEKDVQRVKNEFSDDRAFKNANKDIVQNVRKIIPFTNA